MRLQDRVAIVTGAGRGIGQGIALRLAEAGARLVINDQDEQTLRETEALIDNKENVCAVCANVGRAEEVAAIFEAAQHKFGTVDVMVNNAAWTTPLVHFLDMSEEFLDAVLQNNLKSMFLCAQSAARMMVAQGKPGAIINMSSVGAVRAHHSMVAYDASKGAVEAATRAMAVDLAPQQIRVNAVGPSSIVTPAWRATLNSEANIEMARRMVPLSRLGAPVDIANAVLFLASDDAAFITGQVLYVDGGMTAQLRSASFD